MSSPNQPLNKTKKSGVQKRCPKGTRKNKNGDCIPLKKSLPASASSPVPVPVPVPVLENGKTPPEQLIDRLVIDELRKQLMKEVDKPDNMNIKKKRERCPDGKRKVKGVCVTKEKKTAAPIPISPSIPPPPPIPAITKVNAVVQPSSTVVVPENNEIKTKNALLQKKELIEYKQAKKNVDSTPSKYQFLYPSLDEPYFNVKIASRKEFYDTQYDGTVYNIEKRANELCEYKFELSPHQLFVKNFLSFQTPYNSLLLYHSLGTGKTCSAIGVAEEMRSFMKQVGIKEKILIIASPNLQGNFRKQLFDETTLKKIVNPNNPEEYTWNIESCVGNTLLNEINPEIAKNLPQDKIIGNINSIINQYYEFMGYGELANFITKIIRVDTESGYSEKEIVAQEIKSIRRVFNNRLIIIDEVHNIRSTKENKTRAPVATLLMKVAKYSQNMRLLLLSATPMFNSYEEIVWLVNLMSLNDKRSIIDIRDVFDTNGEFKAASGTREETGKELLIRKLTGYVSYVRGENPYIFPFRLYPKQFAHQYTFPALPYPKTQMNGKPIESVLKHVSVYVTNMPNTTFQYKAYMYLMEHMRQRNYDLFSKETGELIREMPSFENMDTFGYALLQLPLETLNMVYPSTAFERALEQYAAKGVSTLAEQKEMVGIAVGEKGLNNIIKYEEQHQPNMIKCNFEYKPEALQKYKRVFAPGQIEHYGHKIHQICNSVLQSKGIVLIYSQYIDGGIIPMCLALEELGFARFGAATYTKSLFKTPPVGPIDATTMTPQNKVPAEQFKPAKYVIISGDKYYSPNNKADMKYIVSPENNDGSIVKVVLISKSGTEGLDFKCIRQIHIMEPWYNMNRIEQIIGRGVRNLSHCRLPFKQRNVQIYMHSTLFDGSEEEAADLYVYRIAEMKALQIGRITRLLKETAVDCILNIQQTKFSSQHLESIEENKHIELELSSGGIIDFKVGDQPFTDICDYMDTCEFQCSPTKEIDAKALITVTYNDEFAKTNIQYISNRILQLYREQSVYKRDQLIASINIKKTFPIEQIFFTLSQFINNKTNYLIDKYGRFGYLVNKDVYYVFQPVELTDENASVFERTVPVDYRRQKISMEVPKSVALFTSEESNIQESQKASKPVLPPNIVEEIDQDLGQEPEREQEREQERDREREQDRDQDQERDREREQDREQRQEVPHTDVLETQYAAITKKVIDLIKITQSPQNTKKSTDWYIHFYNVKQHLQIVYGFSDDDIETYVLNHILDMMMYTDKMVYIKYLFNSSGGTHKINPKYESAIKLYFQTRMMVNELRNKMGILVQNGDHEELWMRSYSHSSPEWILGESQDYNLFLDTIKKYIVPTSKINKIVGFISEFKKSVMVFKIKDLSQKRNNNGARIDSAGKADVIKLLNQVVGEEKYTSENTDEEFSKIGLCVVLEMVMRKYTDTQHNGLVYYLTPEQSVLINITRI